MNSPYFAYAKRCLQYKNSQILTMSLFKKLFTQKRTSAGTDSLTLWTDLGCIIDSFEIQYLHPDHHMYPAWAGGERHLKLLNQTGPRK